MVILSTTKAKYIVVMHAVKEALWLRTFITEITQPLTCPVTVYHDNQLAILISQNCQYHTRMKHINIHHHFICDMTKKGLLTIPYCPMAKNLANAFTKALPGPKLEHLGKLMGLHVA